MLLREGVPEDAKRDEEDLAKGRSTLRGRVWKTFLQVDDVRAQAYMDLVAKGPCADADVIAADVNRTFQGDEAFHARVKPAALTRVLHAFVHRHSESAVPGSASRAPFSDVLGDSTGDGGDGPQRRSQPATSGQELFGYRQGMNVLAAALLYVMPEVDAFFAFSALVTRGVPRYVTSSLQGVHTGASLVDTALSMVRPPPPPFPPPSPPPHGRTVPPNAGQRTAPRLAGRARGHRAPVRIRAHPHPWSGLAAAAAGHATVGPGTHPSPASTRTESEREGGSHAPDESPLSPPPPSPSQYLAYGVHWNLICCTARVCMAAKDLYTSPKCDRCAAPAGGGRKEEGFTLWADKGRSA